MLKSRIPHIIVEIEILGDWIEETGAEAVEQKAKQRVRRRSGALHDAIHVEHEREGAYVVAGNEDDVFYGHILEHGSTTAPPYPFLVPSLEEEREPIVQMATAALKRL